MQGVLQVIRNILTVGNTADLEKHKTLYGVACSQNWRAYETPFFIYEFQIFPHFKHIRIILKN